MSFRNIVAATSGGCNAIILLGTVWLACWSIGPWFIYLGINGLRVRDTECLVTSQNASQFKDLEPIYCHDVNACYHDPCGNTRGPCCKDGQSCIMEELFVTKLDLLLNYHGVSTDLEAIIKQVNNFTPESDWSPKLGQLTPCWYHDNLARSITLKSHPFYNDFDQALFVGLGFFLLASPLWLLYFVIEWYASTYTSEYRSVTNL